MMVINNILFIPENEILKKSCIIFSHISCGSFVWVYRCACLDVKKILCLLILIFLQNCIHTKLIFFNIRDVCSFFMASNFIIDHL